MMFSGVMPMALSNSRQAMPAAPAPLQTSLVVLMSRPVRSSALIRPAAAMIAVPCWSSWKTGMSSSSRSRCSMMKHSGALMSSRLMPPQLLPSSLTQLMISSGSSGIDLEVDRIDVGEALEQHRLAFHHRLGGKRAAIAEAQDGGAVGDDGDEVALGGVVVGRGSRPRRSPAPELPRRANRRATDRAGSPSAWWRRLRASRAVPGCETAMLPDR